MNRHDILLQQEGTLMDYAGRAGRVVAGEHARAMIDGTANALLRLEGAEACAPFFFALADRVCGGVRVMTVFPAPADVSPLADQPAAPEAATPPGEDASPGEPTIEDEPAPPAPASRPVGWRQAVVALAVLLSLALAWRAGFAAGRAW